MNNIEKKLDALIDALGFDVTKYTEFDYQKHKDNIVPPNRICVLESDSAYVIDYKGMYTSRLKEPVIDYKLTKRKEPLDVLYDGVTLRVLTDNVIDIMLLPHSCKWIAYKKEAYDAVLGWFGDKFVILSDNKSFKVFGVKVILDE